MSTLDIAMKFYTFGISTFPVVYADKRPAVAHWTPYQQRLPTVDELWRWFGDADTHPYNIGVVGGSRNLVVLDFDTYSGYLVWQRWATLRGGRARQVAQLGYHVQTKRGVHVYVLLPQTERCRSLVWGQNERIDIKAMGGYVLGETSVHPDGPRYTAMHPGMVILSIPALSTILPTALLQQTTHLPPQVTVPLTSPATDDPWQAASQPRLPVSGDSMIARIKQRFNVADFFPQARPSGGHGRWRITHCPFHDDQHPSFWLDTERNLCGCFSGCTAKPLDVINLYARLFGLSNREAICVLAEAG